MLRRGPAAAADNAGARLAKRKGVVAEVLGIGRIHDSATDLFNPASIRFHPELAIRHGVDHLLQHPQELGRSAGTVNPDHIAAGLFEHPCHFLGTSPSKVVIPGKSHGGNQGQ